MDFQITGRGRKRFRRISRARILDGHPLQLSVHAVVVMVMVYVVIISVITLLFSYFYAAQYFLVFWTILPGALLGFTLLVLERLLRQLKNSMLPRMGKLLTAFLLFFIHTIGYLALPSLLVNYPMGLFMERTGEMPGMAGEFSLFSVNFFIVLALLSWLKNVRSGLHPCF